MFLKPCIHFGLGQAQNVFFGVGGSLAAANIKEIQTAGRLVQSLLITARVTEEAVCTLLNQGSGFCIVFSFANDLFHCNNPFKYYVFLHHYT